MRFRKTFLLCCVTICAKTGLARYLVDVTALWHASKVFESSLNNLKLFLVSLATGLGLFNPLF